MSKEKNSILIFGFLIGGLSVLGRFLMSGWLFLFGMISILIFGIMQLILMLDVYKYYGDLLKTDKIVAWTAVLIFPLIFLFQFDFGDQAGNFYVYEFITGKSESESEFKEIAWVIAIVSAIIYVITFIKWRIHIKVFLSS